MAISEHTASDRALADRERHVARGVAATRLVVDRAEGARIWDVDGREYVDFAGGLGCQNTGHGFAAAAIHEQVDRYLHQCFMVGMYESYVEVCKLLGETWPGDRETKSLLVNSGAEAVENAVKIARTATGRPAVVVFDHAFHGRTSLTMAMTAKVVPYKQGFGPFPGEVYRDACAVSRTAASRPTTRSAGSSCLLKQDVDPASVACIVLEPVQGEGGFVEMPEDFPRRLKEICETHGILYVDDEVQAGIGRTGPVWAIEHYGVEPDLIVSGKSLGGGLPLAGVTGGDGADRQRPARRARRHLRRQPARVRGGGRGAPRGEERLVPQARRRAGRADPGSPRAARGPECGRRRGARPRADARSRAHRADAGPGQGGDVGGT